jgi:hypothetical protein
MRNTLSPILKEAAEPRIFRQEKPVTQVCVLFFSA